VQIDRHDRLLKPGDHSVGREFNAQAIQTYTVSPDFKIVNNSYGSYTARNTLSSYYYMEIIDPSWFLENRTEFILTKPFVSLNTGLDLRYQRTKAYDDYFFEPANVWDITKDMNYVNVYNADAFYGRFVGQPVPGWPGRYATQGTINGDTNDSSGTTVGPFAQATWKLSDMINLVTGVREDHLSANVKDPLTSPVVHDSIKIWDPSYNGSLVIKPTSTSSVYFTYNYSQNTSGAVGNGGGITGWNSAGTALDSPVTPSSDAPRSEPDASCASAAPSEPCREMDENDHRCAERSSSRRRPGREIATPSADRWCSPAAGRDGEAMGPVTGTTPMVPFDARTSGAR